MVLFCSSTFYWLLLHLLFSLSLLGYLSSACHP